MKEKSKAIPLIAWAFYDFANSAFSAIIETFILPTYFVKQVALNETRGTEQWGWTLALAGVLIALGGPVLGAIADHHGRGKRWLFSFTLLLILGTLWMGKIGPDPYFVPLALGLFALTTIASEFAYVFYNALLPTLAPVETIGRWSGWGWAAGYLGGILALLLSLLGFKLIPDQTVAARASFLLVGIWNLIFCLPIFFFTPKTPVKKALIPSIRSGFLQLKKSVGFFKTHPDLVRFFVALMLFIDGLITLFAFGGIFAAKVFGMSEQKVIVFAITLNLSAGIGAILFSFLDDSWGPLKVLKNSLIALMFFGAFALFAEVETLFWIAGACLGIFVGPCQASSRSYVAKVGPKELITELFGFFTFSGKATAFLGPFLVASILSLTGSIRWALSVILLFFLGAYFLLNRLKESNEIG